jgi:glycosyltransferase involved in cell wall biosynthesis
MKVSIVVPAFNEERYIGRCLSSIVNQSVSPDEIIVVDNNSTDKTAEIAKSFNVKVISQKLPGTINARNLGFDSALYDVIARTDADSVLDKNCVAEIKKYFQKNKNIDAVLGTHLYEGVPEGVNKTMFMQFMFTMQMLLGHIGLIGPSMIIKSSAWKKVRSSLCKNDKEVHEDIDVSIHLNMLGLKIGYAPKVIVWTSTRRLINNPRSFFLEYPNRFLRMCKSHQIKSRVKLNLLKKIKLPNF